MARSQVGGGDQMANCVAIATTWIPKLKMPEGGIPKSSDQAVNKALSSIENVGHAALALSDGTYISWWPDQSVSPNSGFQSPSYRVHSFEDDCNAEGSLPDVSGRIRDLDEGIMRSWWVRVADKGYAIPYTLENNPKPLDLICGKRTVPTSSPLRYASVDVTRYLLSLGLIYRHRFTLLPGQRQPRPSRHLEAGRLH